MKSAVFGFATLWILFAAPAVWAQPLATQAVAARQTAFHDGSRPSRVVLPMIPAAK